MSSEQKTHKLLEHKSLGTLGRMYVFKL